MRSARIDRRAGICIGASLIAFALCLEPSQAVRAQTATLKIFTTRAIRTVLDRVGSDFERTSRHRLEIVTDIAAPMVRRVRSGEPFDILVAAPDQIDGLVKDGFLIADTRTDLARSGIGVAVRQGAAIPDVSSVEAFKQTLLNARSIAFLKEGQSGVYVARLLDDLSIAGAIERSVIRPDQDIVSQLVGRGDVEIGIVVVTQILTTPGVTLAGPLPDAIQSYVAFSAGVSARSQAVAVAKDLLAFLVSPSVRAVMRSQGMQPTAEVKP